MTLEKAIITWLLPRESVKIFDLCLYFQFFYNVSKEKLDKTLTNLLECGKIEKDERFSLVWLSKKGGSRRVELKQAPVPVRTKRRKYKR